MEGMFSDCDFVGSKELGVSANEFYVGVIEESFVAAVESGDFAIFVGEESRPIEGGCGEVPSKAAGVLDLVWDSTGVVEQFFWDTAEIDAGTAEIVAFDEGDFCAVSGGASGGAHAS